MTCVLPYCTSMQKTMDTILHTMLCLHEARLAERMSADQQTANERIITEATVEYMSWTEAEAEAGAMTGEIKCTESESEAEEQTEVDDVKAVAEAKAMAVAESQAGAGAEAKGKVEKDVGVEAKVGVAVEVQQEQAMEAKENAVGGGAEMEATHMKASRESPTPSYGIPEEDSQNHEEEDNYNHEDEDDRHQHDEEVRHQNEDADRHKGEDNEEKRYKQDAERKGKQEKGKHFPGSQCSITAGHDATHQKGHHQNVDEMPSPGVCEALQTRERSIGQPCLGPLLATRTPVGGAAGRLGGKTSEIASMRRREDWGTSPPNNQKGFRVSDIVSAAREALPRP